eukprot:CAMPEP_0170521018 /NCGR_PEP_ID=MMETSP0209-20121228/6353_1 /TAXON_ID=665100 ORGANISM="Litonotus pictus, Strain P1" /NCGR_SAMPLE_ID=MMETSP0209 /ASSEMBLY_ACC=CAM_ASM_000301 /LENGTH=901 /DNA_ID=CAMNT_0010807659 /DNA_START=471 /DNA_END=3176 /DNA_ORIENTATION=-
MNSLLLKDKGTFMNIFDQIDKECFTSFPSVEFNSVNKTNYIKLSERVNTGLSKQNSLNDLEEGTDKEDKIIYSAPENRYYSNSGYHLAEILLFFFEQIVMVRYLIFLDTQVISSFKINTKDYTLIFDEQIELFKFLTENVSKKGEKIFDSIDFKAALDGVIKNQEINEVIKYKTRKEYGHYKSYYSNSKHFSHAKKNPVFDYGDSTKFKNSVVARLRKGVEVFFESIVLISFRRIWSFDSFLAIQLYEEINKMYKQKLIQDLLEDVDNDGESSKKKKKGKQGKKQEKEKKEKEKEKKNKKQEEEVIVKKANTQESLPNINSFDKEKEKNMSESNKILFNELFGEEDEQQDQIPTQTINDKPDYFEEEKNKQKDDIIRKEPNESQNIEISNNSNQAIPESNSVDNLNANPLNDSNPPQAYEIKSQGQLPITLPQNIYTENSITVKSETIDNIDNLLCNSDYNDMTDISTISSIINKQQSSVSASNVENEQIDFSDFVQQSNHPQLNQNSSTKSANKKNKSQSFKQKFFLYDTSKLNKKNFSLKSINVVNHSKCLIKKFSKFDEYEYPFLFWQRLHNDIMDYSLQVVENNSIVRPLKIEIIEKLKQEFFNHVPMISNIIVYGSFATDLSIEYSDVDLRIALDDKADLNTEITNFTEYCSKSGYFSYVNPIISASVPVVKLCIDLFKFKSSNKQFAEKLDKLNLVKNSEIVKELSQLKIDITFSKISSPDMSEITNSISYVQKFCVKFPDLVPLIFILKHYLNKSSFNSAYNGGMSSFCLFIVVLAFKLFQKNIVKKEVTNNLGTFLFEMMDFYGNSFSFLKYMVEINLNGNPFVLKETNENQACIINPLTGLNSAKAAYRISEVAEYFSLFVDYLNYIKIKFDKNNLPKEVNIMSEFLKKKEY